MTSCVFVYMFCPLAEVDKTSENRGGGQGIARPAKQLMAMTSSMGKAGSHRHCLLYLTNVAKSCTLLYLNFVAIAVSHICCKCCTSHLLQRIARCCISHLLQLLYLQLLEELQLHIAVLYISLQCDCLCFAACAKLVLHLIPLH